MTEGHKAALAEGREQGGAVRRYLDAFETHRPRRGRKRTVESVTARLEEIGELLSGADPLTRLHLLQERMNLQRELDTLTTPRVDLAGLEAEFIAVAKQYADRRGITYTAWRELGVPATVLHRAGITST